MKKLLERGFLFSELVKRDFKKKYKNTYLGMIWSLLSPLLSLLVMNLVFSHFFANIRKSRISWSLCFLIHDAKAFVLLTDMIVFIWSSVYLYTTCLMSERGILEEVSFCHRRQFSVIWSGCCSAFASWTRYILYTYG